MRSLYYAEASENLAALAERMRENSERWFPALHDDPPLPLSVFYALGLAGEVGEVANEIKKNVRGHATPSRHADLGEELADVFTYLVLLADELDVDLVKEYAKKAEKNERRWG